MELYRTAVATASPDTVPLLRSRIDNSQNALVMTDFCESPVVIARQRFSRQDFFLYYPLKNQGWRQAPNVLDPSTDNFPIYAPKGGRSVCFSAPDAAGSRNLYITRDQDTLWSAPELLGEQLLSFGNEVFPMLSEDEKTLTFSSDGLYGMGGYDLYRSTWDEETGTWVFPILPPPTISCWPIRLTAATPFSPPTGTVPRTASTSTCWKSGLIPSGHRSAIRSPWPGWLR
jgi:hypothetical protein